MSKTTISRNARIALTGFVTISVIALFAIGCSTGSTSTSSSSGGTGSSGSSSSTWTGGGDGIWRRNAVYAEAVTFDPCNAHQPGSGQYHYHDNPVCLRYQLGDNLLKLGSSDLNPQYTEKTTGLTHSPILGWSYDGYPVYGPYGYSTATSASSGIRRMQSSYALRSITVRQTLPQWAATAQGLSTTLTSTQYGPPVSSTYPLGRYIEDYDYTAGSGDLDQYNGRYCVTPDFPNGTYAYFVTIDSTGAAAFPYYIALQYNGVVNGGTVTSVTESTTNYFYNHAMVGSSNSTPTVNSWFTKNSAQAATIINETNTSVTTTTWPGESSVVDADIQQVAFSAANVYVYMSGMASHIMGPWWLNAAQTQDFPNYPTNQNMIAKIPITPVAATTHTQTGGGAQGAWVNGVAMFNMEDFFSWSNSAQADVGG